MTHHDLPLFMSIRRFTEVFQIGRSKTYDLIGAGKLVAKKSGKLTLIETASAITYMASLPPAQIAAPKNSAKVA